MRKIKENIIYQTVKQSYALLSPAHRKESFLMMFLILLSGWLDIFGLAALYLVVKLASDTSMIFSNENISGIYNYFNFDSVQNFLFTVVGLLVIFFLVKNILTLFFFYLTTAFSYKVSGNLTERKFREFFSKGFLEVKKENSNVTSQNITSIPIDFSTTILMPLFNFFSELIVLAFIIVGIAVTKFNLFILLTLILLPSTLIFYKFIKKRAQVAGDMKNAERYMVYQFLYQNIHGHVDVLLNNKVSYFLKKYFNRLRNLYKQSVLLIIIETAPIKFIEVAAILGIFLIFIYSYIAGLDMITLMNYLIFFAVAAYRLMPSINRIMASLVKIKSGYYTLEVLRGLPQLSENYSLEGYFEDEKISVPEFNKSVRFDNVSYRYHPHAEMVLQNLSFEIKKGEVVGFIGTSGSGKSTIFNIILRLLNETSGKFLVDEKPILPADVAGWRSLIGYVRQDYYLLDTTLAQNIAFGAGHDKIDYEKLIECIRRASLSDFVNTLPQGVNSNIGEHGGRLSGGQKQRIAIARALYHDSEIILFDEATSALDSETENEIMETVNSLFGEKKTMLMIAHRYTTLKKCSRIYEIANGKISRVYTYQELIDSKLYANNIE